jgi:hypothetical protein
MTQEIVMQSNTRRNAGFLTTLAVAGSMGIALLPKDYHAPAETGARMVEAVIDAVEAAATSMRAAVSGLAGGGFAPGQLRSTRQGNDSFRMHAQLDSTARPPKRLPFT